LEIEESFYEGIDDNDDDEIASDEEAMVEDKDDDDDDDDKDNDGEEHENEADNDQGKGKVATMENIDSLSSSSDKSSTNMTGKKATGSIGSG
jgi:hypothetical protein